MAEEPEHYDGTKPGLIGCLVAVPFAMTLALPVLFVWAWSGAHCAPAPACQRRAELGAAAEMAGVLLLAALLWLSVRALVRWRYARAFGSARPMPLWAALVAGLLLLFWAWLLSAVGFLFF